MSSSRLPRHTDEQIVLWFARHPISRAYTSRDLREDSSPNSLLMTISNWVYRTKGDSPMYGNYTYFVKRVARTVSQLPNTKRWLISTKPNSPFTTYQVNWYSKTFSKRMVEVMYAEDLVPDEYKEMFYKNYRLPMPTEEEDEPVEEPTETEPMDEVEEKLLLDPTLCEPDFVREEPTGEPEPAAADTTATATPQVVVSPDGSITINLNLTIKMER